MNFPGEPDDEATTRDHWRARPMIGDIVESIDGPRYQGRVVNTFYCNGQGGLHVLFPHGVSWCWFARYRVVTRWYLLLDTLEEESS